MSKFAFKEQKFKHPIFGDLEIVQMADTGEITIAGYDTNAPPSALFQHVARKSGIAYQTKVMDRYKKAFAKPTAYMDEKMLDLEKIAFRLTSIYKQEFERYMSMGFSDDDSMKFADQKLMEERDRELLKHNQDFPTEITDKIISKHFDTQGMFSPGAGKDK